MRNGVIAKRNPDGTFATAQPIANESQDIFKDSPAMREIENYLIDIGLKHFLAVGGVKNE